MRTGSKTRSRRSSKRRARKSACKRGPICGNVGTSRTKLERVRPEAEVRQVQGGSGEVEVERKKQKQLHKEEAEKAEKAEEFEQEAGTLTPADIATGMNTGTP